jgi:periplasmic protein TonB
MVEVDGRATGCRPVRSSGFPRIDALACRLIERRYVFRPALNRTGRPVRSIVEENHTWVLDEEMMRRR